MQEDIFAVICCSIGATFWWLAWKMFTQRGEPAPRKPESEEWPSVWEQLFDYLMGWGFDVPDSGTNGFGRFSSVLLFLLLGALFAIGGLYLGLYSKL